MRMLFFSIFTIRLIQNIIIYEIFRDTSRENIKINEYYINAIFALYEPKCSKSSKNNIQLTS